MAQQNNPSPDQGGSQQQGDTRNDVQWQQDNPDRQQRNPDQQNPDSGSDKTMGREQKDNSNQGNRQNQGNQGNSQNQSGQGDSQGRENR